MAELLQLDALGHKGAYRAHRKHLIRDIRGEPVADLSLVPSLFVAQCMASLRAGQTAATEQRAAWLNRAARIFAHDTVEGLSPIEYQRIVSRVAGLPIAVVRDAMAVVAHSAAEAFATLAAARPRDAVDTWQDPLVHAGRAVWTRRGDVFAVHAAGNHPGVHSIWLEALAMGFRVAVRPSTREPFTPHRLIASLRLAGFRPEHVALLPTDHAVSAEIVADADLAIVYGGDDVVEKYRSSAKVLAQGPGRAKILLTEEQDWRSHLDTIATSVAQHGGTGCINATAVYVEGDPSALARALATELNRLPSHFPDHDAAALPAMPLAEAQAIEALALRHAESGVMHSPARGIVHEVEPGVAVLRPMVCEVDKPDARQLGVELPFPCVWIAPWSRSAGTRALRNSLVVTALTTDQSLIQELIDEPSISNVYVGDYPTCWVKSGLPHDRYLAEFLMRTKAVVLGDVGPRHSPSVMSS